MSELKACPFCGGRAQIKKKGHYWNIECPEPNCKKATYCYLSKQLAIENWNTRFTEDALCKENTKLRLALLNLFNACMYADMNGELAENIHGDILDQAREALK